ncbi:hypothetical protein R6U77_09530 [Lysinibacillus louembei]|uniref:Uncharacterized protein n=1 Tax=Lysinibacillus louembei TaxID=1470088 RepID=A0ABZ0S3F3_9BACI|nr:hypothetical protein [Lysinibacillus louembei]WPK13864.1 hypothetical protein R6U77_09530 [Lysinibacillus louembei]
MNELVVNKILLSTYGCNLDHSHIYHLVKAHLFPFEVQFDEMPIYAPSKTKTLLLTYDVYDAKFEFDQKSGDYPFRYFLINEERLVAFEQALLKLNSGTLTRCFDARGHIWVTINGLEFATRTLITYS